MTDNQTWELLGIPCDRRLAEHIEGKITEFKCGDKPSEHYSEFLCGKCEAKETGYRIAVQEVERLSKESIYSSEVAEWMRQGVRT